MLLLGPQGQKQKDTVVSLLLFGRYPSGNVRRGQEGHLTGWSISDRISMGPWSWEAAKWEGDCAAEETLLPFDPSLE